MTFSALRIAVLLPALGLLHSAVQADPPKAADKTKHTNRLARETSPYLLQHAHNPVDWYPWGTEAFAKAKKEGKLVFLSIGYSSCYWCHVMERESFEHEDVAKLMNDWFVCIKVDREERPDIDTIYMTALNRLGQRGGWPLSMFLTADGKPIVGGTYWPREDKVVDDGTIRGFKTILKIVHDLQSEKPKELEENADKLAALTSEALAGMRGIAIVDLNHALIREGIDTVKEEFDEEHGGFGSRMRNFKGTKFPMPCYLDLLLSDVRRSKAPELQKVIDVTLEHMSQGGIYDQLGGGFHRYSTERTWTVPHFEKMLYDNAQLAEIYADAFELTKKPSYRRVLEETLEFVRREMTAPAGGFYSALDAETDSEEGRFYVWTPQELADALPDPADRKLAGLAFGTAAGTNFEDKYHILTRRRPMPEIAKELRVSEDEAAKQLQLVRTRLFSVRAKRPGPFLDTKILTAWNGQMIAGYAHAGQVLRNPAYLEAAERAADFVLKNMRNADNRLLRTYGIQPGKQIGEARLNAYLDDYAYLVHGLLCLHEATQQKRWLDEAKSLTETMIRFHADTERGGFYFTSNDHEKLFARSKDQYDGAQPAANSVAARNLTILWQRTGDERYRSLAEKSFKAFAGSLKSNPLALTYLASSLGRYLDARSNEKKEK